MERSLDYSERLTRARIEKIPDGVYEGSDFLEPVGTPGWPQDLIPVQVKITVAGSTDDLRLHRHGRAGARRRELPVLGAVQQHLVHREGDHRSDDPDQPGLLSAGRDHLPGRHGAQLHLSGFRGERRDRDLAAHHRHAAEHAVAQPCRIASWRRATTRPALAIFSGVDPVAERCRAFRRKMVDHGRSERGRLRRAPRQGRRLGDPRSGRQYRHTIDRADRAPDAAHRREMGAGAGLRRRRAAGAAGSPPIASTASSSTRRR